MNRSICACKHIVTTLVSLLCFTVAMAQHAAIDSVVNKEMTRQHIVGLSVGIVQNGQVLMSKGYGYANAEDAVPASENTVYKIGSLSKQIIATCIMQLEEQGKLKLSDPIRKYFKKAPDEWNAITIRNLLNHTSGIERESPLFKWTKKQPDSLLIHAIYKDKLHFAPGTSWEYSNMNYFILADIIRKVSGQSFEHYTNNFFATYQLDHTTTTTTTKVKGIKAAGYNYDQATGKTTQADDFVALRPSGAFSSSITDMIRWDSLQRAGAILTTQDWARMWEDTVVAGHAPNGLNWYYGYGWMVTNFKGHYLVHHGGNTPGFTCAYWKLTDDSTAIIILANTNEVDLDRIAGKIYSKLFPGSIATTATTDNTDEYAGVYTNNLLSMKIIITNDEGQLTAQATGQPSFPLTKSGTDIYKYDAGGIELDFNTTKNEMTLIQHGQHFIFVREQK